MTQSANSISTVFLSINYGINGIAAPRKYEGTDTDFFLYNPTHFSISYTATVERKAITAGKTKVSEK